MRIALALLVAATLTGQVLEEDFHVYKDHPRLLITPQRLKLLRREKERQSHRWQQLELLIAGKAKLPDSLFGYGLYSVITSDDGTAKIAAAAARDLRGLALAYDWLPAYRQQIEPRLKAALGAMPTTIEGARSRVFAAIALEDHVTLERMIKDWWRKQVAPALNSGRRTLTHTEVYPMMELLHVVRDNLNIDLRDDARAYFKDFATSRILSYYPPTFPAPENDFRIPYGPPDLEIAAMSRIAELSLVAYDSNSTDTQFVQGWLMHDRFALRGAFGAPYEFFWANPYQPGLSYAHLPLNFHDARAGRLFLRSSWDEDATWVGYVNGKAEVLREGRPQPLQVNSSVPIGDSVIMPSASPMRLNVKADSPVHWYVLGWSPMAVIDVEADDEELDEKKADRGGILALDFKRAQEYGVRLRLHPTPPAQ